MCSKLSFDDWLSLEIDRLKIASENERTLLSRYLRNKALFEEFRAKNQKFVSWKDDMQLPADASSKECYEYLRFLRKDLGESQDLDILWEKDKYYVEVIRARAIILTNAAEAHCTRNGLDNVNEYIERIRTACKGNQNSYAGERTYDWIIKSAQRNMD